MKNEGEPLQGEKAEFVDMINTSGTFLLQLVESLLDISKIEAGQLELDAAEHDLVKLIEYTIKVNRHLSDKKNIDIRFECSQPKLMFKVDEGKIQQVFNNLISNAIKFSEANTIVTIKVESANDLISVSVSDQGKGISEQEIGKLFKYFSKTSTTSTAGEESTGLGLAICKKIVEAHNGVINVVSEVSKGSVFTVQLGKIE